MTAAAVPWGFPIQNTSHLIILMNFSLDDKKVHKMTVQTNISIEQGEKDRGRVFIFKGALPPT